jgi:hypothetical protein
MAAWDMIPESLLELPSMASVRLITPRELFPFNCRSNSLASFSAAAASSRKSKKIQQIAMKSFRKVDWDDTQRARFAAWAGCCCCCGVKKSLCPNLEQCGISETPKHFMETGHKNVAGMQLRWDRGVS